MSERDLIFIAGIHPYFLERGDVWFEENEPKIIAARKTEKFFQDNTLSLEKDQQYSLSEFLRKLDELGYEKVLEVRDMGEFSHRGGIVHVFPLNLSHAVRIEFVGNRIDEIETLPAHTDNAQETRKLLQKRLKSQKIYSDLKGLKPGDYLVHLDHGVGKFTGFSTSGAFGEEREQPMEYYVLQYAAGDRLFIPVGLERKLSRYVGFSEPKISRLGSPLWQKTKRRAREVAEKLAKELLELYARREVATRPPYENTHEVEEELRVSFPYQETPDQLQTLKDIEHDLQMLHPMDRIVCGDVGFGKTEVALRAMVHAVFNGYQTALLAPTTILVHQHYSRFLERLRALPIELAMLSRIQTKREQKEILQNIREEKIDIVVGTHRLLSRDVQFKNLGLLVIDDEQRFGVKQKEKFREIRATLDVLSLSATPIPRTLHMALSSLKSISMIQTSPEGRLPVHTIIAKRKDELIKQAIQQELQRKGQVYYLHNRVGTIGEVRKFLSKLMPQATYGIAHGRLSERQLIATTEDFRTKKFDVLIATTIIENGLDLPNVGTIIVEDATKLGLAQAYQIKGRVGRSTMQAYAYFLYGGNLGEKAKLRLQALKETQELGSGWRIAMRDLEIRGAGNLLGREQSGIVNAIGLNLYCQMLSDSVEKLRTAKTTP